MKTRRMTMAQALIVFLKQQHVERDGREHAFFAGMVGIFGHGNVAGIGQALQQNPDFPYILMRNEQAGVHYGRGICQGEQPAAHVCLHVVDWAGRDEHDYRRGAGDHQPAAGAAAAGRYFCAAQRGAGAAATGVADYAGHGRERLLQAGVALLGPHLQAGTTDHFPARGDARADFAVGLRRGDAGAAAGRADRSV